ncbi:MAG: NUDIX domain-containing protein [Elusimicrobiota bacterium]|nr:NUDIX domain-containing protein [Elusimicrobiota bacterium]
MLKEFSAGAVIYKIKDNKVLFCLVFSNRNHLWGFPKGHIENGETEIEAAAREIFEEAGIKDLEFIDGFRIEEIYEADGRLPETIGKKIEKHSIYFLAKTLSGFVCKNIDAEIKKTNWFVFDEAFEKLKFVSQKNVLEAAKKKIGGL